jgi:hypothetical protein
MVNLMLYGLGHEAFSFNLNFFALKGETRSASERVSDAGVGEAGHRQAPLGQRLWLPPHFEQCWV